MYCILLWCRIVAAGDGRDLLDHFVCEWPVLADCPLLVGTRFILAQRNVDGHHLSPLGPEPLLLSVRRYVFNKLFLNSAVSLLELRPASSPSKSLNPSIHAPI